MPLVRVQIVQGKELDGKTDNVLKVALSEINSQESPINVTKEKANTARIAAITLVRIMFQWMPLQQEQLDLSEFSSFVETGSSVEIVLPISDLPEIHLTGKKTPKTPVVLE